MGWNKKWQNCHMNFHQIRWSYHHLNYHQFWQIPPKITILGEKKVNKSSHWPSPNTGKFPQKSYYQSKPVISSLNFDRNCKKTTTVVSLYYNFIQPVGRASSLSCSGHRGYKLCSLDDRSKTRHPVYFWPKKENDMRRILATNICATFRYFVIKLSDDKKISLCQLVG